MRFLLDTNLLAELRKGRRASPLVRAWASENLLPGTAAISALTVGEIRKGIESTRRRDRRAAEALENWFSEVLTEHEDRILPVDQRVAEEWGRLNVPNPLPAVDGLLAATAKVHNLTLVTRNVKDIARTGVPFVNPFEM